MNLSDPVEETIRRRYSVRTYEDRPIEQDLLKSLQDCLDKGNRGPFGSKRPAQKHAQGLAHELTAAGFRLKPEAHAFGGEARDHHHEQEHLHPLEPGARLVRALPWTGADAWCACEAPDAAASEADGGG